MLIFTRVYCLFSCFCQRLSSLVTGPVTPERTRSGTLTILLLVLISSHFSAATAAEDTQARTLFANLRQQVFQIRVIDLGSGDKHVIGSGFSISPFGHIATNFHVVSDFVHQPQKYRIEYVQDNGQVVDARLLTVDIIHDLAILQTDNPPSAFLPLSQIPLDQGDRIYAMGNPRDLGMSIVEGTYNGELQQSRYRKILFSGSLNPGMSGGPAFNSQGEIIGINVSTGGEQLSFLVPVVYLQHLLEHARTLSSSDVSEATLGKRLYQDQQDFYSQLLATPFPTEALGGVRVAARIDNTIKCWGNTSDDQQQNSERKRDYQLITQSCQSDDGIFLAGNMSTGELSYRYQWLTSDTLNPLQFYYQASTLYRHDGPTSSYSRLETGSYQCTDSMVELKDELWKVSACFRAYRKYPQLYDASLVMASTGHSQAALIASIGTTGISRDNATRLFRQFMEAIEWQH